VARADSAAASPRRGRVTRLVCWIGSRAPAVGGSAASAWAGAPSVVAEGFEILLLAGAIVRIRLCVKKSVEKKLSPLSFSRGHNCLWRSHAYSLGLTSSQVSVSHRGPLFWQREPFRKLQEQPRSLRD
jgi:hypothetical protein